MKGLFGKKSVALVLATAMVAFGASCEEEESDNTMLLAALALASSSGNSVVTADISSNTTWSGTVQLNAAVQVKEGVTLTILPGTKIYGASGSALFVNSGAKIEAVGTATQPIVFTSAKADGSRAPGDWGGLLIIGKARIDAATTYVTEGLEPQAFPGVSKSNRDDADSSGTLKYVRVEYAGYKVAEGNELNGVTLYSVGSGTTIENLQVHMGSDDGLEIFGGAVNVTNLLLTGNTDDSLDIDTGYHGTVKNVIVEQYPASLSGTAPDEGFEHDGFHNDAVLASADQDYGPSKFTVDGFTIVLSSDTGGSFIYARNGISGTTYKNGALVAPTADDITCKEGDIAGSTNTITLTNIEGNINSQTAGTGCTITGSATVDTTVDVTTKYTASGVTPDYTLKNSAYGADPSFVGTWNYFEHK